MEKPPPDEWAATEPEPKDATQEQQQTSADASAAQTDAWAGESAATTGGADTPRQQMYCYPLRFPERYGEQALAVELGVRLAGRPADGSRAPERETPPGKVIWVDAGDEVLAHLDSLQVRLLDSLIVASLDLECDQTGRTALVCVFATGQGSDEAGLLVTTDELPRGNALLAARWGEVVQNAIWAALAGLLRDHADERRIAPAGLAASPGALLLVTTPAITTYPAAQGGGQ